MLKHQKSHGILVGKEKYRCTFTTVYTCVFSLCIFCALQLALFRNCESIWEHRTCNGYDINLKENSFEGKLIILQNLQNAWDLCYKSNMVNFFHGSSGLWSTKLFLKITLLVKPFLNWTSSMKAANSYDSFLKRLLISCLLKIICWDIYCFKAWIKHTCLSPKR